MTLVLWTGVLAVVLVVYHRLPMRAQTYWLLLVSYAFYAWWAWPFLPVLVLLTLSTYVMARRIAATQPSSEVNQVQRRRWLSAGVALNLGALAALRYGYRSAPFEAPFAVLGISFYSLQALAYLFDTYSGILRTPHTLADFAVYLAYFPKLIAGPIERPHIFLDQLRHARIVDDDRLARAATLIAVGLTRKLVLADPLAALLPAAAFTAPASLDACTLAMATVGYAFVLYNDFAGYTSIARGVSCLFGIELSRNFAQPFFAHNFTDLWNRWHISLSHWLRDYVYLPLSRRLLRRNLSRTNLGNLFLPPVVTMLAAGLWHGASTHMLVWGGLHGIYLVVQRVGILLRPPMPGVVQPAWSRACGVVLVFTLSCLAFIALRLPIALAAEFWERLFTGPAGALPEGRVLLYMLPSLWLDWMQARQGEDTVFMSWPLLARGTLLATAALLWLAMSSAVAPTPFVYQGF
ncbi:MAG TPA: MBOAT family O-acyltransferase [Candidatus Margulisiibacteriota bacterium]|nr:MBOAT family O-acyltransferase [Candidatus Margulisiibacteriota bacterium]